MILCAAWLLCGAVFSAVAADETLEVTHLTIGLDGTFKLGTWTAVEFDLTGPAGLEIIPVLRAADPDGHGTLQPLAQVTLAGDSPIHVRGLFRSGKLNAFLQLQLQDGERIHSTIPLRVGPGQAYQALKQSTRVWLTVGDQPLFSRGLERWNVMSPGAVHQIPLADLSRSLWSPAMLDGVDVLVLTGNVSLDQETSASIQQWTQRGGRLILSVGDTVPQLAGSPLAKWLPLVPQGQVDVAKLSGIQDLVPRSGQLRTLTTLRSAQLDRTQGLVIAPGLASPLAMRAAYGNGQVTVVAVRLDEAPLSTWDADSQARLAAVLAPLPFASEADAGGPANRPVDDFDPSAVTDLQSQLNQTLEHFSGISRAAPWGVIGWIALFAIVIGPVDYLVVRHWLKHPEWTWGTMLFWVVLASVLAIWRGDALNQHAAMARQIDSVDVDITTNTIRGQSWYTYYSDLNQRQKVEAVLNRDFIAADPAMLLVSWVNRPGEGYRGMSGSGGLDETRPQYQFFKNGAGIENFPVRKWSTGAVTCEWESSAPAQGLVEARLQEGGLNRMTGTIQHHLPGELTDWFLAYGNFAYFDRPPIGGTVQPLPPGKVWNVGQAGSNLLRGRVLNIMQEQLTGRQTTAADDQLQRINYDSNSTNPLICELVISFYQAIEGQAYTGLKNESLRRLDLSETISLKRAVLFGRLNLAPTQYRLDGQALPVDEQSVMVRIILPVEQISRDPDAPPPKEILQLPK